jgi:hypothetical protein
VLASFWLISFTLVGNHFISNYTTYTEFGCSQNTLKLIKQLQRENGILKDDVNRIRKTYLRLHSKMSAIGCMSKGADEPLPLVRRVLETKEYVDRRLKYKASPNFTQ